MIFALYALFYPVVFALGTCARMFSTKIDDYFSARENIVGRVCEKLRRSNKPWIWVHVASSGELELAIPVLWEIKNRGNHPIFLTYFSGSGKKAVDLETKRSNGNVPWDESEFSPFDFRADYRKILKASNVCMFIVVHRELWLNAIYEFKRHAIPIYLIGTYFSQNSLPSSEITDAFNGVTFIDSNGLKIEDIKIPTLITGDPRVERISGRIAKIKSSADQNAIVYGSFWPEDFEAWLPHIQSFTSLKHIFVPHEMHSDFLNKLKSFKNENPNISIEIIEQVGGLVELYAQAKFAFVGGGFKKNVHSVLEPALYGLPLFTGPLIQNSLHAIELKELGLLASGPAKNLALELEGLLKDTSKYGKVRLGLQEYCAKHLGASKKTADFVLNQIHQEK